MSHRSVNLLKMLQQFVRKTRTIRAWRRSVGWQTTSTFAVYRFAAVLGLQPSAMNIKPPQTAHALSARLRGSSDMDVFNQIFVEDEYACIRGIDSPALIFDLGANVGYSTAYFLNAFPAAMVVAVEPDPANFEVCRANLAPYGSRARAVCGAVWSSCSRLALSRGTFGDGREWASEVREPAEQPGTEAVQGWDIPSLLRLTGKEQIDLLKVDIEGSEVNVFGPESSSWLHKVSNICIELHGPHCEEVFFHALRDFEYELSDSGELTVCTNLRPKPRPAG
jgi:FkbM family methyltransferase